jgi:hypothetical protein
MDGLILRTALKRGQNPLLKYMTFAQSLRFGLSSEEVEWIKQTGILWHGCDGLLLCVSSNYVLRLMEDTVPL